MRDMERRQFLKRVLEGAFGLGITGVLFNPRAVFASGDNLPYRWDIINIFPGPCAREGGESSSKSLDGARLTLTGSGTFRDNPGNPQNVTGGGTWRIPPGAATPAGSGTYEVTRFISFDRAPGTFPIADCIGSAADARAGRLTVGILFSDGSEGVLELGCRLTGTPGAVMEGITATKGFVTFWNHEEPVPGVEGNRTLFHVWT